MSLTKGAATRSNSASSKAVASQFPEQQKSAGDFTFHEIQALASAHLPPLRKAGALTAPPSEKHTAFLDSILLEKAAARGETVYVNTNRNLRYVALGNQATRFLKDCGHRIDDLLDSVDTLLKKVRDFPEHREEVIVKSYPALLNLIDNIRRDLKIIPKVTSKIEECNHNLSAFSKCLKNFKAQILKNWDENGEITAAVREQVKDQVKDQIKDQRYNRSIERLAAQADRTVESLLETYAYQITKYVIKLVNTYPPGVEPKHISIPLMSLLVMTQAKGILFDVDDTLIMSEKVQKESWSKAFEKHCAEAGLPQKAADEATHAINTAFSSNRMDLIRESVHGTFLKYANGVPKIIDSASGQERLMNRDEFDEYLTGLRVGCMKEACLNGEIKLAENTRALLIAAYRLGLPVGTCTSSPRLISEATLPLLLDMEEAKTGDGFTADVLIPKAHRTYGDDGYGVKPNPFIWLAAVSKLTDRNGVPVNPENVLLIDDNYKAVAEGAAVKQYDRHYQDLPKKEEIKQFINDFRRSWGGIVGLFHEEGTVEKWVNWLDTGKTDHGLVRVIMKDLGSIDLSDVAYSDLARSQQH